MACDNICVVMRRWQILTVMRVQDIELIADLADDSLCNVLRQTIVKTSKSVNIPESE